MRTFIVVCLSFMVATALFSATAEHKAVIPDGIPGSPNFGYGGRLDPAGDQAEMAIQTAGQFGLDWIGIEFDWASLQPSPHTTPDWSRLDDAMALARENGLGVMVSIVNPPDWAVTSNGPDRLLTSSLCRELAHRYGNIQALEIFPGPNTIQGWGAYPNPKAYVALLKSVHKTLDQQNAEILLVSGGLLPFAEGQPAGSMDDLTFLEGLYAAGISAVLPIIGIQLPSIQADPTTPPGMTEGTTLRHYEAIRAVMLASGHQSGLIWVTGFSWDRQMTASLAEQSLWLKQAYLMMRRQLYIGAAFFQNLNPSQQHPQENSLIHSDAQIHPGFDAIGQIIAQETSSQTITFEWTVAESNFVQPTPQEVTP